MKILSVIESLDHGGAATVLAGLVLGLGEHEHRSIHFSSANRLSPHPGFLRAFARAGIRCDDVHWSALQSTVGAREALGGFEPDVVFFHWWGKDPWERWLRSARELPLGLRPTFVCVLHHAEIRPASIYDHYVLVTRAQRSQVDRSARAVVIPNGIDLERFHASNLRRNGRELVVGRLSRLEPGKIPEDWVETAISYDLPGTRFAIGGEGSIRARLERDARDLGVADRFHFAGYVPRERVPEFLSTLDVFCYQTSTAIECHPLALLEAMAAGVPVVAEARGGIPDVVTHGVDGLLASSPDEIGEHLHRLQGDPDLCAGMALRARRSARRFTLARQLESYRSLLGSIHRERAAASARGSASLAAAD